MDRSDFLIDQTMIGFFPMSAAFSCQAASIYKTFHLKESKICKDNRGYAQLHISVPHIDHFFQ